MDWKSEVKDLHDRGYSNIDISAEIKKYFPGDPEVRIYNRVRRITSTPRSKKKNEAKKEKSTTHVILQNFDPSVINCCWDGSSIIKFAVVSDTHMNSIYTQITHLHEFYRLCDSLGIKDVYHSGDMDDGEQMRVGHCYECYTQGGDAHIENIVKNYPKVKGITTHFITGNHDASIYKKCGMNIGNRIAELREDMDYLGSDVAHVNLTDNCTMELRHPWDGTAYAISYKPQKIIESIADGEKPNILFTGHYHKQEYIWYKGVHAFQSGCFCAQTNFMRGKGISAAIGGWIVSIVVDSGGTLKAIAPAFIPFEHAIPGDYKNYLE